MVSIGKGHLRWIEWSGLVLDRLDMLLPCGVDLSKTAMIIKLCVFGYFIYGEDYILTASQEDSLPALVLFNHALRNSLAPLGW
jgi:hypothetical protein